MQSVLGNLLHSHSSRGKTREETQKEKAREREKNSSEDHGACKTMGITVLKQIEILLH